MQLRSWRLPAVTCLAALLAACGGTTNPPPPPPPPAAVASVSVTPADATVEVGQTTTLSAQPKDASGAALSGRSIAWTSSDPTKATVSTQGVVTGVAVGGTTITATAEGQSGAATIAVIQPRVATVAVTMAATDLSAGDAVPATATPKDAAGNVLTGRVVTWTSSTPAVATVSDSGRVIGISAGTTTVSATSEGKTGTVTVTVRAFVPATTSQTIGAAGGTITLTSTNGTAFEFVVPAGAVRGGTTFTLATRVPVNGKRFNLVVQPAGLIFLRGNAATVTVTLPGGQRLAATGGMGYNGHPIPYTVLSDGRLRVRLASIEDPGSAAGTIRASAARQPPVAACGAAQDFIDGGLNADDLIVVEAYASCMLAAAQNLALNEQYAEAVNVASTVAAYLQAIGEGNPHVRIAQASSIACVAYRAALDRATAATVSTMGTLYGLIKPIMFWEMTVQRLGTTCPAISLTEYQTVIATKTDEAKAYYATQKPQLTSTTSPAYTASRVEAQQSAQTVTEVTALAPPPAVQSTLTAQVTNKAQPSLLDAMLQAPWNRCRVTRSYDELISLMASFESPAALQTAAQYCGTQLSAQTKDSTGVVKATLTPTLGGVSGATQNVIGKLNADKKGHLLLTGPILSLECPASVTGGTEALVVKVDGTTIQSLQSAPYLGNTLDVDIAAALQAAHPGGTANITAADVTFERAGTPCAGFWGTTPVPLLTLTLDFLTPFAVDFIKLPGTDLGLGGEDTSDRPTSDRSVPFTLNAGAGTSASFLYPTAATMAIDVNFPSNQGTSSVSAALRVTIPKAGTLKFEVFGVPGILNFASTWTTSSTPGWPSTGILDPALFGVPAGTPFACATGIAVTCSAALGGNPPNTITVAVPAGAGLFRFDASTSTGRTSGRVFQLTYTPNP